MKVTYENLKLDKDGKNTKSIDMKLEGLNSEQIEFIRILLGSATIHSNIFTVKEHLEFGLNNLIQFVSNSVTKQ